MDLDRMLRDERSLPLEFDRYPFFNKDSNARLHGHGSPRTSIRSSSPSASRATASRPDYPVHPVYPCSQRISIPRRRCRSIQVAETSRLCRVWCGRDARAPGWASSHDRVTPRGQHCRSIPGPAMVEGSPSVFVFIRGSSFLTPPCFTLEGSAPSLGGGGATCPAIPGSVRRITSHSSLVTLHCLHERRRPSTGRRIRSSPDIRGQQPDRRRGCRSPPPRPPSR